MAKSEKQRLKRKLKQRQNPARAGLGSYKYCARSWNLPACQGCYRALLTGNPTRNRMGTRTLDPR